MAIPLILAGATALFGAKKALNAKNDNNRARNILHDAEVSYNQARNNAEDMNEKVMKSLENLGKTKLKVWDGSIRRFIEVAERTNKVNIDGKVNLDRELIDKISPEEIGNMRVACNNVADIVSGGVAGIGTGALVSVAAYGGTALLGTASTGTAIASLSGVVATNATLASLGGGALTAGGLGIAGGTMALGGLVLGPALAVGGVLAASKARNNLADAREKVAEASVAVENLNNAASRMRAIKDLSKQYNEFISDYDKKLNSDIDIMEKRLDENEVVKNNCLLECMHICALDDLSQKTIKVQKTGLFTLKNFFLKLIGKGIEIKTLEILIKDYLEAENGILDLNEIKQILSEKLEKEIDIEYPDLAILSKKVGDTKEKSINYRDLYEYICKEYKLQLNYSQLNEKREVLSNKLDETGISTDSRKINYEELDTETRERMHQVYSNTQVLKNLLETSILAEDGALNPESQELLGKIS